jgi:PAS domain S-box-containing protein
MEQQVRSPNEECSALRAQLAQVQQELSLSQERLRQFHEDSLLPCYSLDPQDNLVDVNAAWLELFGYQPGEILGQPLAALLTEDSRQALPDILQQTLVTGRVRGAELIFRHRHGPTITVIADCHLLRQADGSPLRTHCTLRNITRERAELRLAEDSAAYYRTLFDDAAIPIAVARDLKIIYANNAQAACVGYDSREELLGLPVLGFIAPQCVAEFAARAQKRMQGQQVENQYEVQVLRKNGSQYTALATVSSITLPDGPALLGFFQDISERSGMETALRESELRFRTLFDDVPAIAAQGYDQDRNVLYWNEASARLYGYSQEEALGRKLEELIIPPNMRPLVAQAIRDWVEKDIPIPAGELEMMRKDGSLVSVFSSHVMQQTKNNTRELYCLDIDLTDLIRTRFELQAAKEEAEAADRAKGEFLANMSHEIRTPLNGVLGMLQLLRSGSLDEEMEQYAELAYNAGIRLLSLLNDVLDFSRMEYCGLTANYTPLDLTAVIRSVAEMFSETCAQKGVALEIAVDPSLPDILLGDEARLRQILFNLVGNAAKFTTSGHIRIEAWSRKELDPDGQVRTYFSVQDTGVGIPDDKLHYVFERFTQSDSTYTRQFEGAGLGLAIVKRIITLLGGNIVVESEPGKGTAVYWDLRLRKPEMPTDQSDQTPTSPTGRCMRILLADDDSIGLMAIRTLLERRGHLVTAVTNGLEALRAIENEAFDCVLMDIQMPVMNGVEVTNAIRNAPELAHRKSVPIIALTAYAMPDDRETFLAAGMDDYLSKPVQESDLLATINKLTTTRPNLGNTCV